METVTPKILIGDDHGIIRRGISLLIQMEIGNYTVAEADSCSKVMAELNKTWYTHLILDVIFPDGNALEILPNIKSLYPYLKILIFSMQPPEIHGEVFKNSNALYLSKTTDNETLLTAITNFLHNTKKEEEAREVVSSINPFKTLSSRELQILHYMLNGLGTKQIAEILNLKMNSVSTLKKRIYSKTECTSFKALIDLCTLYKINY